VELLEPSSVPLLPVASPRDVASSSSVNRVGNFLGLGEGQSCLFACMPDTAELDSDVQDRDSLPC
jgi:hypothetical protein